MATNPSGHVAVVGLACRFPGADSPERFWRRIADGVESVRPPDGAVADPGGGSRLIWPAGRLDGVERFDAEFFGVTSRDAVILDPQHRLLLETGYHALEDAGYDTQRYDGDVGVFVAVGASSYLTNCVLKDAALVRSAGIERITMANGGGFAATRLAYKLNLRGPCLCVDTTCSGSLTAVHLACRSLQTYECDMALAGGVRVIAPPGAPEIFEPGGILSRSGRCRAFDVDADGTVVGSGIGLVVLKRLEDAVRDRDTIRALVIGSAVNNDGSGKVSYTAPSGAGQARVISAAMAFAGVTPDAIHYVEAHGTGTSLGDPIEVEGLKRAFGERPADGAPTCAIGSVKSNIGHLDAAAGIAGFIKVVLALQHRKLPPAIHVRQPNPELHLETSRFRLSARLEDWTQTPRRAGVSSFGVGGTNVHVVLQEAAAVSAAAQTAEQQVLVLSAHKPEALDSSCDRLAEHLAGRPDLALADVAYTLNAGRPRLAYRFVLRAASVPQAISRLTALRRRTATLRRRVERTTAVAFVFPGAGHYTGMLRDLCREEPACRDAVRACVERLAAPLAARLEKWLEARTREPIADEDADLSRVYLFVAEYALARLWMSKGVKPAAVLGWGVGESVAACLAGILSLDHCLASIGAPDGHAGRPAERGKGEPAIPIVSTQTGTWATERDAVTLAKCALQLNAPSDVDRALGCLVRSGRADVLLRIGPSGSRREPRLDGYPLVASIGNIGDRRPQRDVMTRAVARLAAFGVDVDWAAYYRREERRRIPLPTYPFGGQRYWAHAESAAGAPAFEHDVDDPDVEAIIVDIWRELFGDDAVHRDSDFLELGGDSLLASQVVTRISERLRVPLDVTSLWQASTPARLAAVAGAILWQRQRAAAGRADHSRESGTF